MGNLIYLRKSEENKLWEIAHRKDTPDIVSRANIILMAHSGKSFQEIVDCANKSKEVVKRWINDAKEGQEKGTDPEFWVGNKPVNVLIPSTKSSKDYFWHGIFAGMLLGYLAGVNNALTPVEHDKSQDTMLRHSLPHNPK